MTGDARPSDAVPPSTAPARGSVGEVARAFLKLGLTSFGGPIAHLGYFRAEFVERRRWVDDARYADLVALCQFLPGPASSQVGFALGLGRAGWLGAVVAWMAFTAPSAIALVAFAQGVAAWPALAASGALQGLMVAAVAVVAQAVWSMARSLCPDAPRAAIAVAAAAVVLVVPSVPGQVAAIVLGGVAGRGLPAKPEALPSSPLAAGVGRDTGAALLVVFAVLLAALPLAAAAAGGAAWPAVDAVYRAGALVFGGGHVVLPLLEAGLVSPGHLDAGTFLAGYGAAQAVPGPLFSFAAFIGAAMAPPLGGWPGALVLLVAIFLPGLLLVAGALPFWDALRARSGVRRAMAGINAAVVGVLAAALWDPLGTGAILSAADLALAAAGFLLLVFARVSPVAVVALAAAAGWALGR